MGKSKPRAKTKCKSKGKNAREDTSLWSLLPAEIVTKIFRLLPFHHAIKAKGVCRQWRTTLSSLLLLPQPPHLVGDMFLPVLLPPPSSKFSPWFGFHFSSRTWARLPSFSFLPFTFLRCLSSHKGLLLLEQSPTDLHLCNFVTQKHKSLPPRPLRPPDFRSTIACCCLLVDDQREAYSILALLDTRFSWPQLLRFDSTQGAWTPLSLDVNVGQIPIRASLLGAVERMVVLSDLMTYALVNELGRSHLVEFDISGGVWRVVCTIPSPSACIVGFQDTFLVVALDRRNWQLHLHRFRDGELCAAEARTGPELADFVAECAIGCWYVASWDCRICVGVKQGSKAVVEYNASSRSWWCLPPAEVPEGAMPCPDAFELGLTTNV